MSTETWYANEAFPRRTPYIFSGFVVFLFAGLILMEYSGTIPHYCIFQSNLHSNATAIIIVLSVFIITVFTSTYIGVTFMKTYRRIKQDMDDKNRKLMQVDREKMQFFRFTSHELKAPIVAIKSSLDGVVAKYKTQMDERAIRLLQRASFRAEQLLGMIKELLEITQVRQMKSADKRQIISLDKLINEIIDQEKLFAESKKIALRAEPVSQSVKIHGNYESLKKVIDNLITNAIRYSHETGAVIIRLKSYVAHVEIEVEDSGIGIDENEITKIFDEFYRTPTAKQKIPFGTGLGLSLVKQIVENHGGEINVISHPGKGSCFRISLPVNQ